MWIATFKIQTLHYPISGQHYEAGTHQSSLVFLFAPYHPPKFLIISSPSEIEYNIELQIVI